MNKKIGFWYSKWDSQLPRVEQFIDSTWDEMERLTIIDYLSRKNFDFDYYKGSSNCRICGVDNGSADVTDGEYTWPSGYSHYLEYHDVKPPADFIQHVIEKNNGQ